VQRFTETTQEFLLSLLPSILAFISASLAAALLVSFFNHSPLLVLRTIWEGAFGDGYSFSETLLKATPLICTGLAVALAFRAGIWNIGAEGQFIAGAMTITVFGVSANNFWASLFWLMTMVCVFLSGAVLGMIVGWLREKRGVSEVISTIMLNAIALQFLSYALHGPLQEIARTYPQSDRLVDVARLSQVWPGTRLHSGVMIVVLLAIILWIILFRLPVGFRLRVIGQNPRAARFAGINVSRHVAIALALSGGVAAIGGAIEVAGVTGRLYENISPGYGYTGIAVAMLGRLHPLGVLPAAFLFGALESGARALQRNMGISPVLAEVIQGMVILFVVLYETRWFRERLTKRLTFFNRESK
jgi:simple sugar transport system permease protein